jgi:hypothetical protein
MDRKAEEGRLYYDNAGGRACSICTAEINGLVHLKVCLVALHRREAGTQTEGNVISLTVPYPWILGSRS